jgi:hypothetical protein
VLAAIKKIGEADAMCRRAVDEAERLTDPAQSARAWALLSEVLAEQQRPDQAVVFARRLSELLGQDMSDRRRNGLRARVTECLAEAGYLTAAQEHADAIANPADKIRALCAIAQRSGTPQAVELLRDTAALLPSVTTSEARRDVIVRLADAAAGLALDLDESSHPAWAIWPVAELLASDSWSRAAPALARLDPGVFEIVRDWVIKHLDRSSAGI